MVKIVAQRPLGLMNRKKADDIWSFGEEAERLCLQNSVNTIYEN
ncbi:hypothetical protein [Novibacillus thermophilus]|nr:hypothetical protein [Novibacillus thermophilus]